MAQVEHIADDRPAAGATGACRDAVLAGEADEVPDDQEVAREPHSADDAELVFEPGFHGSRPGCVAVAFFQAVRAQLTQISLGLLAARRRENGEVALLEVELDVDAVRDFLAPLDRVGELREQAIHVGRRADVVRASGLAFGVLPPTGFALLAGVDAEEHVVGVAIRLAEVMGVSRGHERDAELFRDPGGLRRALILEVEPVVLDLDVEVVLEDTWQTIRPAPGPSSVGP